MSFGEVMVITVVGALLLGILVMAGAILHAVIGHRGE